LIFYWRRKIFNNKLKPITDLLNTKLDQLEDNETVDFIVIGSGGAGFSAALTALIKGSTVLLIERTPYVGGTTALSASTSWVPCTRKGLQVNPGDTLETAAKFLNNAVGERSDPKLRQVFLENGHKAVTQLEDHTALQFQVRSLHPDYLSELEGSVLNGRAIEPQPFDGKLLGPNLTLIRPPIPEFTVLDGMMVDRDDIFHLLRLTQTWTSFSYSLKIIVRHLIDKILQPRSTRLVMGNAMIARMLYSFIEKGGKLLTSVEVTKLLTSHQRVSGVTIKQTLSNGSSIYKTIHTKYGIVLAGGGFNKHSLKRAQLLPGIKEEWSPGAPGHTGALQELAIELGAAMGQNDQTHAFWAPVSIRKRKDGSTATFPHFVMDRGKPGMLSVDSNGQRFVNESTSYHLFGLAMQEHHKKTSCIPTWLICDAAALKRYGLGMIRPGAKSLESFISDGYLKQGYTIADLAEQINVPTSNLVNTVNKFNTFASSGMDEDFQRGTTEYQRANGDASINGLNPCLGALNKSPFYAIALYPGDIGASTGLLTDVNAQVLNTKGQEINGLYACGNEMHSIMGAAYPGPGITIGPGITFGYIAACHAIPNIFK